MIENENSERGKYSAKPNFEILGMAVGESAREYVAGVEGKANFERYNDVEEEGKKNMATFKMVFHLSTIFYVKFYHSG